MKAMTQRTENGSTQGQRWKKGKGIMPGGKPLRNTMQERKAGDEER